MIGAILAGAYGNVAPLGDFESIATVSVGAGGAANVEFTSIPGTYQHLQVRYIARGTNAAVDVEHQCQINGATGSVYSYHIVYGDGASTGSAASSSNTKIVLNDFFGSTALASTYGVGVMDILDYANTNKYKTTRTLIGRDRNGAGIMLFHSGLYQSTNAITSLKFFPSTGNFAQYTHFALYGIKG
jgi:hypothetical protein